jgi:hypothetical protein
VTEEEKEQLMLAAQACTRSSLWWPDQIAFKRSLEHEHERHFAALCSPANIVDLLTELEETDRLRQTLRNLAQSLHVAASFTDGRLKDALQRMSRSARETIE